MLHVAKICDLRFAFQMWVFLLQTQQQIRSYSKLNKSAVSEKLMLKRNLRKFLVA